MTAHAPHESLPGYQPEMMLFDGCPECEARAQHPMEALLRMDDERLQHAWERAIAFENETLAVLPGTAEARVLREIVQVARLLDRFGSLTYGDTPTLPKTAATNPATGERETG